MPNNNDSGQVASDSIIPNAAATAPDPMRRPNPSLVATLLLIIAGTGALIWWEERPVPHDGPPRA